MNEKLYLQKGNVLQHERPTRLFRAVSRFFQFISALPVVPPPFALFPSFLIHLLCITPLLSSPIYSALPLPIVHTHTSSPSFCHFAALPCFSHCILTLFSTLTSFRFPLCLFFPVKSSHTKHFFPTVSFFFISFLVSFSLISTLAVCTAAVLPFSRLFKACHVNLVLSLFFFLQHN